jgi:molybdate transport repressor ModE-like protein
MTWCPELTSLRLLHAIETTGSISEAARMHGVSQPAASKRIRELERSMAVSLLERTPVGSQLTWEGRIVVDWAGRVFETIEQMFDAVESMRAHGSADLRLASSMTIAEHLVPGWLSALRLQAPDLHVGLRVANSQDVQRLVLEGHADIGLVEAPTVDERLESALIAHDRLVVVVAPSHGWATRRQELTLDELAQAELIVREAGSGTREALDRWLRDRGSAEPYLELGSNAAVKGAVRAGAGPAVLSILAVNDDLEAGRLVEVPVADLDLRRPLQAVWRREHDLGVSGKRLLELAVMTSATP